MNNKNIIFKRTLKEYNKRYRHHKNLLKFTKKEVEEFDKTANTVGQLKLLDHNNWWFIDGTYYQAPRVLRPYWFRNLNAGAQTAICLLGAGIIATGASLPFILKLGQTVEPTITITGADFDKSESHIELHKESTIVLKEKSGKEITGIEYVKVADKTLDTTEYSFNQETKIVTINAEAMTSTKIEIKVKTGGEPTVIKVTSVQITNTVTEVKVGEKIELTTEVLPENATNKELEWSMEGQGEGDAEFVEEGGKTYLKGITAGEIEVTATAKDGSGKSDTKTFTVTEDVTTKDDFIKAYKDFRTKFNTETTKTYKPSQIKVASWNQQYYVEEKNLSDLTYSTTGDRSAIFKFGEGEEKSHRFDTNFLSDDDLNSLLKAETESSVTYTIDDNYIQYSNSALPVEDGLYGLTVNKDGYIVYYSKISGGNPEEFSLNITGNPEIYYNIDWATSGFNLGIGGTRTLYESAKNADKIEFVKESTVGGICVGEADDVSGVREPVYAGLDLIGTDLTLKIWSAGKIRFTNNDLPLDYGFFESCSSAKSFDFSNIDTSKVTNFDSCFRDCKKVENLDLSYFDTYSAINMASMFQDDDELKSVDVSSFNTSNVTDMDFMFNGCSNLTSLDLSPFVTSKVTEMYNMFCNCYSLESVNVSSFDTSSVVDMSSMFSGCLSLKTLDVSNFDTSSVEDMCDMFCWCLSLKTLDLSSFKTEKVEDMREMFKQDKEGEEYENNLTTIYVGENFTTESVTGEDADKDMFSGCTHLVGGNGTQWTQSTVDKTYAKIDKEGQAGYFTDAKELPTSDSWFYFTKIEDDTAYSVRFTDSGAGEMPTNFVIPSTHKGDDGIELPVTQIESNAFTNIDNPVSLLVIPSSITSIGKKSFDSTFINDTTDIRFKDTTHTWTIKDSDEEVKESKFNPSAAETTQIVEYLTGEYTWSKNITDKEKFLEKATEFTNTFLAVTSEYGLSDITVKDNSGNEVTMDNIEYLVDEDGKRIGCEINNNDGLVLRVASNEYTKEGLETILDENGIYNIKSSEITYEHEGAVYGFNKNGYATKLTVAGENYTIEYTGDPK